MQVEPPRRLGLVRPCQQIDGIGNDGRAGHQIIIYDRSVDKKHREGGKRVRTSKSGPPELRKALFQVMDSSLKSMPQDDPVYQFMDKKRAKGKPCLVYITAGASKFLRIYYRRVKEYLAKLGEPSEPVSDERI